MLKHEFIMASDDSEASREDRYKKFASLLELTSEVKENLLDYIGDRFVEESEVYEHLKNKKVEYYLCIMLIQALSSHDMGDSPWHSRGSMRYKQLYEGIERKYIDKSYYLKKRSA
jgi:hypothetical protein